MNIPNKLLVMNRAKLSLVITSALAAMALLQGCALLLVGGAAAGAAYGTVKFVNNSLESSQTVQIDRAWDAANAALKEMQIPILTANKDATYGKLEARNAHGQTVTIQVTRGSSESTNIKITVGTFDTAENRSQAQLIFDKMKAHF